MIAKKEGVTLTALIITVVILLILLSISVGMAIKNDSVVKETATTVAQTEYQNKKYEIAEALAEYIMMNPDNTDYDIVFDKFAKTPTTGDEFFVEGITLPFSKQELLESVKNGTFTKTDGIKKNDRSVRSNTYETVIGTPIGREEIEQIPDDLRQPMVIRILPDANNKTNIQVFSSNELTNCKIDWGDGEFTTDIKASNVHTYPNRQERTVKIFGNFKEAAIFGDNQVAWNGIYWAGVQRWIVDPGFLPSLNTIELKAIENWGENNFGGILYTKGTNIPYKEPLPRSFENLKQYSLHQMPLSNTIFANAPKLEICGLPAHKLNFGSIPPDVFKTNTDLKYIWCAFAGYSGTIPANLFANNPNIRTLANVFQDAKVTGTIPPNLLANNRKLAYSDAIFSGCRSLTGTIPPNLFDNKPDLYAVIRMFAYCNRLTGNGPAFWTKIPNYQSKPQYWKSVYTGCTGLSNYNSLPANAK